MLYVTVFDNLRAGSTAACRQLPTVIRCAGWQQRLWPRDATWSPGHLPSYHLSTGYQHHHHHHHYHYQHLNHRAHYHHDHYPHDDADHHDHDDDQTITDWSVCDVANRRVDSGNNILANITPRGKPLPPSRECSYLGHDTVGVTNNYSSFLILPVPKILILWILSCGVSGLFWIFCDFLHCDLRHCSFAKRPIGMLAGGPLRNFGLVLSLILYSVCICGSIRCRCFTMAAD